MGNLLFSPKGRINSSEMMTGGLIIIVIGALLGIGPVIGLSKGLTTILGLLGYVLIVPWVFLWIKRYRINASV